MNTGTNTECAKTSTALFITGVHRSGTSAVTRVCNLLGTELGPDLLPPGPDNPRGYWENRSIMRLHDEVFAALGSSWDDCRALPTGWHEYPQTKVFQQALTRIVRRDFGTAALWGLKDPRLCRLMPLWHGLTAELGLSVACIIVLRHPLEVAASLAARNGFPLGQGLLLWLRHNLELELHSRAYPRVFITYDELLHDWRAAMDRIAAKLSIAWPLAPDVIATDVDAFLTSNLRHHRLATDRLQDCGLVDQVHSALLTLAAADDENARGVMDEVSSDLAQVESLYDPFVEVLRSRTAELTQNLENLRLEMQRGQTEHRRELAVLLSKLAKAEAEINSICTSRSWRLTQPLRQGRRLISISSRALAGRIKTMLGRGSPYYSGVANDPAFHLRVERARIIRGRLEIEGWAFHEEHPLTGGVMLFNDGDALRRIAIRTGIRRDDVHSVWQKDSAHISGFHGVEILDATPPKEVLIKFNIQGSSSFQARIRPTRKRLSAARLISYAWRSVDRRRLATGIRCVLRGDWRYLWDRIVWLAENSDARRSRHIALQTALDLLEPRAVAPPPLQNVVDIIVPVYDGFDYLAPLFRSIAQNTRSPHRLIVVDDASPDRRVRYYLEKLVREHPNLTLLRNDTNLGFVATVNRAATHAAGDFVLLNTDVEVPPYWLERLMAPMQADRKIASITPFSNAATICSFPEMNVDNPPFAGLDVQRIDRWFQRVRTDVPLIDLPTGVGFCMGVNGDVWRSIGEFDELTFERGYGEENDWCLRAKAAGYRNVITPNLFIHHKHGGSFSSAERDGLRAKNLRKVQARHPNYQRDVHTFIRDDPLVPFRELMTMLIACAEADRPPLLVIDHELGGGANLYRKRLVEGRLAADQPVLLLTARRGASMFREPLGLRCMYRKYSASFELKEIAELEALFGQDIPLAEIFYNNAVTFEHPSAVLQTLRKIRLLTGARLSIAIHDFYALCPSYNLLHADGAYCGLPEIDACRTCLPRNRYAANPERTSIESWRKNWGALLEHADRIVCFSEDSRKHVAKAYPQHAARIEVCPHTHDVQFARLPRVNRGGPLHVGIVGAIGYAKGAKVVADLARFLLKTDPQARLTVIGTLENAPRLKNLTVTGAYKPAELPDLLERLGINVCFLPSIWPETFSYVTAELMALDIPIAYFGLGAPAERLRVYAKGIPIPVANRTDMAGIARALHARSRLAAVA